MPPYGCPRLARFDPDSAEEQNKRQRLFWTVCLLLRGVLAACATLAGLEACAPVEHVLAGYAAWWGLSLLRNFATQLLRPNPEERGNFNGRVWWQPMRLIHGVLLCAYAATTFARIRWAFAFALADVGMAVGAGVVYYGCLMPR